MVPFPISYKRSIYLITKWLLQAIKDDTRKLPMSEKLSTEIYKQ